MNNSSIILGTLAVILGIYIIGQSLASYWLG
jgi:hypothetical protein